MLKGCALLFLLIVSFQASSAAAEERPKLVIGAASSLREVLEAVGTAFEKKHSAELRITYAASGKLGTQIAEGAPIDVLLTARAAMLDDLESRKLISSRNVFAANTLVVIVPSDSKTSPGSLSDLTERNYRRIGIGNPAYVPAGYYAKAALEQAGLYRQLESRFIFAEHVRQALVYVARGTLDAAFVYRTDAALSRRVRIAFEVPLSAADPVAYSAAVTTRTEHPMLSRGFAEFLNGSVARAILIEHGFAPPPASPPPVLPSPVLPSPVLR